MNIMEIFKYNQSNYICGDKKMKNHLSFINKSDGGGTFIPQGKFVARILNKLHQFRF